MTGDRTTRALRAAVFTALAVPLAALGQVVVTGRQLPLTLVALCSAAVFLLALALAGSRLSLWRVCAVMLPVELVLNTAFNLGQDGCTAVAARSHGVDLLVCGGGSVNGSSVLSEWAGQYGGSVRLLVLLVHLALALAAALWLSLGDAALRTVVRALHTVGAAAGAVGRALLLLAPLPACPAALPPAGPFPDRALPRPDDVLLTPAPRRGPPAYALAC
ncbi:hypothetical protein [Kitasatospora sp. NPDC059571]|uniref:hypothetical protein n=1 Tax=Kitasatospora sp. NPDC059571 TaxID=3346871 RepID=UPI0036C1FE14